MSGRAYIWSADSSSSSAFSSADAAGVAYSIGSTSSAICFIASSA